MGGHRLESSLLSFFELAVQIVRYDGDQYNEKGDIQMLGGWEACMKESE